MKILFYAVKILFICIIYIGITSICFAFQNEPNGFRNLYWGETLQEVQNDDDILNLEYVTYHTDTNSVVYKANLKNPYISGQKSTINYVDLYFWNNQLYKISIMFLGIDFYELKNSMTLNFGYPIKKDTGIYSWNGNTTVIELHVGGLMGNTDVILISPYLLYEAKKEVATKGW